MCAPPKRLFFLSLFLVLIPCRTGPPPLRSFTRPVVSPSLAPPNEDDRCISYSYGLSQDGCTGAATIGFCSIATSRYDCNYYINLYADSYDDFDCEECSEDNCNTNEVDESMLSAGASKEIFFALSLLALSAAGTIARLALDR